MHWGRLWYAKYFLLNDMITYHYECNLDHIFVLYANSYYLHFIDNLGFKHIETTIIATQIPIYIKEYAKS